jgi:2,4-dienoyl-CoA reductase-like NADH-dependent reductase (Old Yellow Enzyme family)
MHLLTRIQRYLRRSGATPTAFGRAVMNDPQFVHDLRRGREPRFETAARVHAWLDAHEGAAR